MANKVDFTNEKLINGLNIVADAVKSTLGAAGRPVIIDSEFGQPIATKDGATVAKSINLADPVENIGAKLIREVASNAAAISGDGTTTATVLAQKMIQEGQKALAGGWTSIEVKTAIEKDVVSVLKHISENSKPVETTNDIVNVATISMNGDAELGAKIGEAAEKVGKDGVITVELSQGRETEIDVVQGMQFKQGYMSPYFVTDANTMKCELDDVKILISEKRITNLKALLPILEPIAQSGQPLLIIADDIDGEALSTLVVNRVRGGLKLCAVKAPEFGANRKEALKDIAVLTGGIVVSDDMGMSFDKMTLEMLGSAKKITVDQTHTTIVKGNGDQTKIDDRVAEIRKKIEETTAEYAKGKLQERLAKLIGGVAVIKVGGLTEAEAHEKKDRVDDAVAAVRAAREEGIVAGGGTALLRASTNLDFGIVKVACEEPFNQLCKNAGLSGDVFKAQVLANKSETYGLNLRARACCDMLEAGIIDPAKVVKTALKLAASCATIVLTSGGIISEIPKPAEEKHPILR